MARLAEWSLFRHLLAVIGARREAGVVGIGDEADLKAAHPNSDYPRVHGVNRAGWVLAMGCPDTKP